MKLTFKLAAVLMVLGFAACKKSEKSATKSDSNTTDQGVSLKAYADEYLQSTKGMSGTDPDTDEMARQFSQTNPNSEAINAAQGDLNVQIDVLRGQLEAIEAATEQAREDALTSTSSGNSNQTTSLAEGDVPKPVATITGFISGIFMIAAPILLFTRDFLNGNKPNVDMKPAERAQKTKELAELKAKIAEGKKEFAKYSTGDKLDNFKKAALDTVKSLNLILDANARASLTEIGNELAKPNPDAKAILEKLDIVKGGVPDYKVLLPKDVERLTKELSTWQEINLSQKESFERMKAVFDIDAVKSSEAIRNLNATERNILKNASNNSGTKVAMKELITFARNSKQVEFDVVHTDLVKNIGKIGEITEFFTQKKFSNFFTSPDAVSAKMALLNLTPAEIKLLSQAPGMSQGQKAALDKLEKQISSGVDIENIKLDDYIKSQNANSNWGEGKSAATAFDNRSKLADIIKSQGSAGFAEALGKNPAYYELALDVMYKDLEKFHKVITEYREQISKLEITDSARAQEVKEKLSEVVKNFKVNMETVLTSEFKAEGAAEASEVKASRESLIKGSNDVFNQLESKVKEPNIQWKDATKDLAEKVQELGSKRQSGWNAGHKFIGALAILGGAALIALSSKNLSLAGTDAPSDAETRDPKYHTAKFYLKVGKAVGISLD